MLSLSDAEYAVVQAAAAPIHASQRDAFLRALAEELGKHPAIGVGVIYRCAAELQKRYGVEAHSDTSHSAEPRQLRERQAGG